MRAIREAHDTIAEGQRGIGINKRQLIPSDMAATSSGPVHSCD